MSATAPAARRPAPPPERDPADARRWLKARREELKARYLKRPEPARLLASQAALVDALLARLWNACVGDREAALVAVGGYGRGALYPHSDEIGRASCRERV